MDHDMTFRTTTLSVLARVQAGLSHTELVHVPHPLWPLLRQTQIPRPLRIAILDSSFNPPTLAHLALINASIPDSDGMEGENVDYDARLLLLSVKNADKTLKATDATYIQRLEMMHLLAEHVPPSIPSSVDSGNVAIGITNEPTFVGKSTNLLSFLRNRIASLSPPETPHLELSFIVGMDTLERLVAQRYYDSKESMVTSLSRFLSPEEDNSIVVCARRNLESSTGALGKEDGVEDVLKPAREFIRSGRIKLMDISADESTFSSTTVRNSVRELGASEEGKKVWGRFVVKSVADFIVGERLYSE